MITEFSDLKILCENYLHLISFLIHKFLYESKNFLNINLKILFFNIFIIGLEIVNKIMKQKTNDILYFCDKGKI